TLVLSLFTPLQLALVLRRAVSLLLDHRLSRQRAKDGVVARQSTDADTAGQFLGLAARHLARVPRSFRARAVCGPVYTFEEDVHVARQLADPLLVEVLVALHGVHATAANGLAHLGGVWSSLAVEDVHVARQCRDTKRW
ncbi:hypothetical protein GQ42DRAFT_54813, partial [Ramicandelaber brevisporus]